jgi:hypothetical protein
MKLLLLICCVFWFVTPHGRAEDYSVIVEGVPRPVTMSFPPRFRLAANTSEKELREMFLKSIRKSGPSFYNEVLLEQWTENDSGLPNIVVGSVASMADKQGQLTPEYWRTLKQIYATISKKHLDEMINIVRLKAPEEARLQTTDSLVWSEIDSDPNTIIIFSHTQAAANGLRVSVFTAQKTILHNGYAVFAQVSIDSSLPNALKTLKTYLDQISIKGI